MDNEINTKKAPWWMIALLIFVWVAFVVLGFAWLAITPIG